MLHMTEPAGPRAAIRIPNDHVFDSRRALSLSRTYTRTPLGAPHFPKINRPDALLTPFRSTGHAAGRCSELQ
eukprot:329908-Prymnesium_polylepis.1